MTPIMYIVLNGELKMSAGKAAAQSVHAAMMIGKTMAEVFTSFNERTVIVLEAKNTQQIVALKEYLKNAGVYSEYYIDEGVNEVDAYSVTALAVEPFGAEEQDKRKIFEPFDLFPCEKEDVNYYAGAWSALSDAINNGNGYFGSPWHVRWTLDWLYKRKEMKSIKVGANK